jgi:hypoxanthine-DNA glycosylase
LLLGSFPGEASLAAGEYYAFRHNQFWRLVGDVLGIDLVALPYVRRVRALHAAHVGLWDVIGACRRAGSLDGSIREAKFNDFGPLVKSCPRLRHAFFNGKTAARHVAHVAAFGLEVGVLPSSSPANTMRYADKLAAWEVIKCAL